MLQKQFVMSLLFFSIMCIATSVHAAEHFVSVNGSDDNEGTRPSPLQTIEAALQQSKGGDTIYVLEGVYDTFTDIRDYTFTSPVTITPYPDHDVIIDGSTRDEDDLRAAFVIRDSKNIIIDGFEIRNITTDDDDFYPAGILVRGNSQRITLKNNHIHHIENNADEGNAHGLLIYGDDPTPMKQIIIEYNVLHNLVLGSSESLTITGNVNGFKVSNNRLYDNNNIGIDIAGFYEACTEENCTDVARNGEVTHNSVLRHSSLHNPAYEGGNSAPGIYVDGGRNIKIQHNFVSHNNFGISVASENEGKYARNIYVSNNVIIRNDKAGIVIGGSDVDNGGIQNLVVSRNSFIHNDQLDGDYHEVTLQQNLRNVRFIENRYETSNFEKRITNNNKQNATYKTYREKFVRSTRK